MIFNSHNMNAQFYRKKVWYQINRFIIINLLWLYLLVFFVDVNASEQLHANPENYLQLLKTLKPGDQLLLEPGVYKNGLPLHNIVGNEKSSIVIAGLDQNNRPVFLAREIANTISIINSSYVELANLELDGMNMDVDAIKAEGHAQWAHNITIDSLYIHSHNYSQQNVGISTKCPAWNWVIRNTTIENVGTGMYFGDSDGTAPFVAGIIEHNRIINTTGYNVQIKHQISYPSDLKLPDLGNTIIRGNIFTKEFNASHGSEARPNLLVGHWPKFGRGEDNFYYIYGNFFYQNTNEALFQGEGRIAFYNNLLVNSQGKGIGAVFRPHNGDVESAHVFYNTVITKHEGISVTGLGPYSLDGISNNVIFSVTPIADGPAFANIKHTYTDAEKYLVDPFQLLEKCSLYPINKAKLSGRRMDPVYYKQFPHSAYDMNGHKREGYVRGAFSKPCMPDDWRVSIDSVPLLGFENLETNNQY